MSFHRTIIRLSALLASLALGWACGGDSATAPEPARPTTVTVSPATRELTALGTTVQLSAEVRDQNARVMAGATVTWTSSANSVATVDASGLVTVAGNGTATITASAGSASGSAVVTVMQSVASVEVSPSVDELTALGQTVQLTAEAFDENGHAVAGAEFSWESSDAAVATVDAGGLVTAVAEGVARITASAGEASGSAVVTVMQPVASVEVSPSAETIGLGSTLQLTAEAFDENGEAVAGVAFSWESSDAAVATVDAGGLVTAVAEGVARITASAGEASGSAVVTVMQPVASVEVSPSAETIGLGSTLQLTAEAFDENGEAVAGVEFSWESSDAAIATVDESGLVTGVAEGVATITASAGQAQGTAKITVNNPDRAALVALYEATDGPNWVNNDNWLTDAPLWDWYGVDTDVSGRVVGLDLCYNDLSGPIPSRLGNLGSLTSLCLGSNNLSGPIPPELGNLTNLAKLWLSGGNLSGPIPPEFGNLAKLEVLALSFNDLTGPIPPELGKLERLRELGLRGNRGLCLPADPQFLAWLAERFSFSFFPCKLPDGRRLPSALMREDGNGLSLALPGDLRDPSAVTVSDPSVVAASAVGGWLELSPRGRGSAEVTVVPSGGGDPAIAEIAVRAAVGTFGIDIALEQPAPTGYEETLVAIADWWSSVLDGTEWPDRQFTCMTDKVKALADDMLIYATTYYRDSSTSPTGYADLCPFQSGLPIGGELGTAYGFGHYREIIAHEIGHHLGLVGIWPSHLVSEDGKYFIGSRAVEAYRAAGGDYSLPGVPMNGVHWGAGVNDWLLGAGSDIGISLAALADAGYTVDRTKTRPVGRPQAAAASFVEDVVLVGPTAPRPGAAMDSADPRPSRRR